MAGEQSTRRWLELLDDEDIAFIKRFVLLSGSLKRLAAAYGISYPTVRLRLDRLIQKIEIIDDGASATEFERLLRVKFAEGKVEPEAFKLLLSAYHREKEE